MKSYAKRIAIILKWGAILGLIAFLAFAAAMTAYGIYFSSRIDARFSNRRWKIPSIVYSDSTLLYPGQRVNRDLLHEKIFRIGYHAVSYLPKQRGEVRFTGDWVDIYLKTLKPPRNKRKGFAVRIRYRKDVIEAIVRRDTGEELDLLELEGEEMMLFFGSDRERRHLIAIRDVPKHVIHAVMAAEDSRFYQHHGFDPLGITRALIANLRHGSVRQGGSTLTQQLAKNYFLSRERTLSRKLNELFIAIILEIQYEKDEILEIYLNEIYFGQSGSVSINGIGEAAQFYFGKQIEDLSLNDAAVLAGLIKAPNRFSPLKNKTRSLFRRNQVLRAMQRHGWLPKTELDSALSLPLESVGYSAYGRKAPYFMDYLAGQLAALYPPQALSSLGLAIHTTLDTQVQIAAEQALKRGLERLEARNHGSKGQDDSEGLQGAIIVMQPKSGYIRAMVGGRSYHQSQFNRVTQAKRQPGSAFKPFVYLSALDQLTPASILANVPRPYKIGTKVWRPKNFSPGEESVVSLRRALTQSYNLATVNLAMAIGLDSIVATARKFNFSTPLEPYPSLALGAFEVIPLELARGYCAFAADGVQPLALSLREVVDDHGNVMAQRHTAIKRLITPAKAFIMTNLMQAVVTEGTARSLGAKGIRWPVAGKTGTTNNSRDAWFIGYTPDILALVWVGYDNGDSIDATGATAALPIWADLMKAIPEYVSERGFNPPPDVIKQLVCTESGELAIRGRCPRTEEMFFLKGNVPGAFCHLHRRAPSLFFRSLRNLKGTTPFSWNHN